jgi:hypothetical protein
VISLNALQWSRSAEQRPDLEVVARGLLYQHGLGLGFLATVTGGGRPRVHPICPILAGDLYAFIVPGPKLADLRRSGHFALCSETCAPPRQDDNVYLTGMVREREDPELRQRLTDQLLSERSLEEPWPGFDAEPLFELHVDRVLVTLTLPEGGLPVGHTLWMSS